MAVMYEHYDEAGWEHTQLGWYECSVRTEDIDKYDEMTQWLLNNIGKYKRHCRWCVTDVNVVSFKFRYERDYILFTLRWS
jgi:hypothetical protein